MVGSFMNNPRLREFNKKRIFGNVAVVMISLIPMSF